ncbi:MAG TPA: hypothetical protein PKA33_01730 [Amaricoccus sp.]|uniref:hypothetical protein n=1 Tax=Amaricoccus sp. TaxID=1872485 RepID=UPI002B9C7419|nr:hypothetical protein [Amaricoccus sp.]HMR51185.1 hypothetical protein [Amaricoccus sp.]HMT98067.1 hypothetical protein [Amaricoccus sp.]
MTGFEYKGQSYTLGFGMAALKAYQAARGGETVVAAFNAMETTPDDANRLSALFRAACKPAVSEEEADEMIDALGITRALTMLADVAREYFEDPSDAPRAKSTAGSKPGSKRG